MHFAAIFFFYPALVLASSAPFQQLSEKAWTGRIDVRLKASATAIGSRALDNHGRMLLDVSRIHSGLSLRSRFGDAAAVQSRRAALAKECKCEVPDLARWISIDGGGNLASARLLVDKLNAEAAVDIAYLAPRAYPASIELGAPTSTPSWSADQYYLNAAPEGLGVQALRKLPGGSGENVSIGDIEGTWYAHEDLPTCTNLQFADLGPEFGEHGTAVLGEMVGRDNGFGVTGIAPKAKCFTASHQGTDVAYAIDLMAGSLSRGDIMVIEVHIPGPNTTAANEASQTGFVPAEYEPATFDAIKGAVASGIIVVAAAGNGQQDLDDPIYSGYFDRSKKTSGSILVGAAASIHTAPENGYTYAAHEPEWFTNFGSRVDVFAYGGYDVYSTGYGDLSGNAAGSNEAVKYTASFAGTSSATPMISGAAALLQSIRKGAGGAPLNAAQMLAALQTNGTAQESNGAHSGAIGVMPNLAKASLQALDMCGDGKTEVGEVCDDGNRVSGDGCSADCKSNETCGNGILDSAAGEVCDDGNVHSGDGCAANCKSLEVCGDGIVDSSQGEVCDDGNTRAGDGCSANCKSNETCGNGVLDVGEVCDDGNHNAGDGCSIDCQSKETCGNGILDKVTGEVCDDGAKNGTASSTCAKTCLLQSAVNGTLAKSITPPAPHSGCAASGNPLPFLVLAALWFARRRRYLCRYLLR